MQFDIVEFNKALSVLNLDINYTEEELKKKYRKLMKTFHTDLHQNEDKEKLEEYNVKSQEVNLAYEYLKKCLDSGYRNQLANPHQTYNYQTTSYSETDNAENIIKSYLVGCKDEYLFEQVRTIVTKHVISLRNKTSPNEVIKNFKNALKEIYKTYLKMYAEKNNIPYFIYENGISNYDCNPTNFISQLDNLATRYKNRLQKRIDEIIKKFENSEYYLILKPSIDRLVIDTKNKLMNISTTKQDYDFHINNLTFQIIKIINTYTKNYRMTQTLINEIGPRLPKEECTRLFKTLEEACLKSNFSEIYNEILESLNIVSIDELKDKIYHELNTKYMYAITSNPKNTELINELFIKSVEILQFYPFSYEVLSQLSEITFLNPEQEIKIINSIYSKLDGSSDEFLCISTDRNMYTLVKVKYENEKYYARRIDGEVREYSEEKFRQFHHPIDKFLEESKYLGYWNQGIPSIAILYYNQKYGIVIGKFKDNNAFTILSEKILLNGIQSTNKDLSPYENIEYLKEEISKYFDKVYQRESKRKR